MGGVSFGSYMLRSVICYAGLMLVLAWLQGNRIEVAVCVCVCVWIIALCEWVTINHSGGCEAKAISQHSNCIILAL